MGNMERSVLSLGSAWCGPRGFCASILASVLMMHDVLRQAAGLGRRERAAEELGCLEPACTKVHHVMVETK